MEEQRQRFRMALALFGAICWWCGMVFIYSTLFGNQTEAGQIPPPPSPDGIREFLRVPAFVLFGLGLGFVITALCLSVRPQGSRRMFFVHKKIAPREFGERRVR
jgi:hypothetical protein